MQDASPTPDMQESGPNAPPSPSEEGYAIIIHVTSKGYEVHGPEPLPAEPQAESPDEETAEMLPDLTTAIKHVLAIIKENPTGQDEQAGFNSATSDMG